MSRRFCKGFVQDESLTADEQDMHTLYDNIKGKRKPTGLNTPNRKIVSPEAGVRQQGIELAPNPYEWQSKELADDYIKQLEYILKEDEVVPNDEISIFLQRDAKIGGSLLKMTDIELERNANAGLTKEDLLEIQNGKIPGPAAAKELVPVIEKYWHLASYVHADKDAHYQVALHYSLQNGVGFHKDSNRHGNAGHWHDFTWFNVPVACRYLATALHRGLTFAWQSKFHHAVPRPEFYGYLLQNKPEELDQAQYIKESDVGLAYLAKYNTLQIRQFFPEGSPQHPSYPQGHMSVAFGVVTALKYILDTDAVIDGKKVQDELDKLAYNIAYARTYAGVHWFMDTDLVIEAAEKNAVKAIQHINKEYPFEVNPHNIVGATGKRYIV